MSNADQSRPQHKMRSSGRLFVQEQALMLDSFRLGRQIFDSGFRPDYIVAIWRGGSSVGIVVQECLQYLGNETDHIAIRTSYQGLSSYSSMVSNPNRIRVHGLGFLERRLEAEHRLLVVDDVFSSGASIEAVRNKLRRKLRQNTPEDIRVASVWYRPVDNSIGKPDFFVNRTSQWLVLPYELDGLTREEIEQSKPWVLPMLDNCTG